MRVTDIASMANNLTPPRIKIHGGVKYIIRAAESQHPEPLALSFSSLSQGATNSAQGAKRLQDPFLKVCVTMPCMRCPPSLNLSTSHTAGIRVLRTEKCLP